MAHHDTSNPSDKKSILWIIVPVTIAMSLLMTKLNSSVAPVREQLDGNVIVKKAAVAPAPVVTAPVDSTAQAAPAAH